MLTFIEKLQIIGILFGDKELIEKEIELKKFPETVINDKKQEIKKLERLIDAVNKLETID